MNADELADCMHKLIASPERRAAFGRAAAAAMQDNSYKNQVVKITELYDNGPIEVYAPQHTHPHPSFSPNGQELLFTSDRTGCAQIFEVKVG